MTSDESGSGSDESNSDSNSGHSVGELVSCSGGTRSVKPSVCSEGQGLPNPQSVEGRARMASAPC